ncbi:hypothetical protein ACFP2T_35340 [Plantactinospora solaniradicis]|uniref:Uncharacterized protein n=1 Tax=Plantactinospora solaniradicis TaxID=1723736 RepID=A0ABW1KI72_9ACTN
MFPTVTRRALLTGGAAAGLALALPATARAAEPVAYAAFRIVRSRAGEPSQPEIVLPEGYQFVSGAKYNVASRAEYYTFVTGPSNSSGIEVEVFWPGVQVKTVVYLESRLLIRRDPINRHRFRFTLPVTRTSADANQPTIQIWSYVDRPVGIEFNLVHNDPSRAAGPWLDVPWPRNETRSQVHQAFATHAILNASGLKAAAAAKGHRWFLQGFETNNALHPDNPPHWNLSYNSGPSFSYPTHNGHFWLNSEADNFYNGMDVTGLGRLKYYVGDPAPIYDFGTDANGGRGDLVATLTIREDGGLDIAPPSGPVYAIAAGRDGTLINEVTVLRDSRPWLRIETEDRYDVGKTTVKTIGLQTDVAKKNVQVYRYDPLTGALIAGQ